MKSNIVSIIMMVLIFACAVGIVESRDFKAYAASGSMPIYDEDYTTSFASNSITINTNDVLQKYTTQVGSKQINV